MKRVLTFFQYLDTMNIGRTLLGKDPGKVVYHLAKDCGCSAAVVYPERNGEDISYPEFEEYVSIRKLRKASSKIGELFRFFVFCLSQKHKFDILILFGVDMYVLVAAVLFRICNRQAKVYMKADLSASRAIELASPRTITGKIKKGARVLLANLAVDLFSVELECLFDLVKTSRPFRGKTIIVRNGFDHVASIDEIPIAKKSVILTVGRMGTYQKNADLLVDAFASLPDEATEGWELWLCGPLFTDSVDITRLVAAHVAVKSSLTKKIKILGNVPDRSEVFKLMAQARFFCLPSRWEGSAFVPLEASYFDAFYIGTDLPTCRELVETCGEGVFFPVGDVEALSGHLLAAIRGDLVCTRAVEEKRARIRELHSWQTNVGFLFEKLTAR